MLRDRGERSLPTVFDIKRVNQSGGVVECIGHNQGKRELLSWRFGANPSEAHVRLIGEKTIRGKHIDTVIDFGVPSSNFDESITVVRFSSRQHSDEQLLEVPFEPDIHEPLACLSGVGKLLAMIPDRRAVIQPFSERGEYVRQSNALGENAEISFVPFGQIIESDEGERQWVISKSGERIMIQLNQNAYFDVKHKDVSIPIQATFTFPNHGSLIDQTVPDFHQFLHNEWVDPQAPQAYQRRFAVRLREHIAQAGYAMTVCERKTA